MRAGDKPECSVVTLCVATITALTAVAFVGIAFRFVASRILAQRGRFVVIYVVVDYQKST